MTCREAAKGVPQPHLLFSLQAPARTPTGQTQPEARMQKDGKQTWMETLPDEYTRDCLRTPHLPCRGEKREDSRGVLVRTRMWGGEMFSEVSENNAQFGLRSLETVHCV